MKETILFRQLEKHSKQLKRILVGTVDQWKINQPNERRIEIEDKNLHSVVIEKFNNKWELIGLS